MRYGNLAASIAILSGALAFAASSAGAAQMADQSGCVEMQEQVKTALDGNAQSPNYHEAVKQQQYGLEFCTNGFYQHGVDHYAEALKLLGAEKG